ncbi:hypothetical protein C8Q78DRAFT_771444 [Trametes maxima]|nr:hypothetical protein C8Q78DRAFT_771444 [Trametes maxima]
MRPAYIQEQHRRTGAAQIHLHQPPARHLDRIQYSPGDLLPHPTDNPALRLCAPQPPPHRVYRRPRSRTRSCLRHASPPQAQRERHKRKHDEQHRTRQHLRAREVLQQAPHGRAQERERRRCAGRHGGLREGCSPDERVAHGCGGCRCRGRPGGRRSTGSRPRRRAGG